MSESELYGEILLAHSHGDTRLMRLNAGMAYQGRVIERTPQRLILSPWYPVRLAAEGVSDLLGWTTVSVQDFYKLNDAAIFTAIECKVGRKKPTPQQASFLELVKRHGGRSGIARSVEDAKLIIRGENV